MARKKPERPAPTSKPKPRSRAQEFKANRRKSWVRFLSKLALLFVPLVAFSLWLIFFVIGLGNELPILVLDLVTKTSEQRVSPKVWKRSVYGIANSADGIKFPSEIKFGGPENNALVVFNDLLGSAKPIGKESKMVPAIFIPKNNEEHQTHAYRGLLQEESPAEKNQWLPIGDYLYSAVGEISQNSTLKGRGKILFAIDLDHPNLPGRMPPQANAFISLCKQDWNTTTRDRLAADFPELDVYVWFSHSEAQQSYYDSDHDNVESFFKRRFERGIDGDAVTMARSGTNIYYSDFKKYLKFSVESDSNIHKLAQTPTFLEPAKVEDFPLLRKVYLSQVDENNGLFDFENRSKEHSDDIERLWERFDEIKINDHWTTENPLLVQRCTMMLLQMERLWFRAKSGTELFDKLSRQLDRTLKRQISIKPVKHTLYDALAAQPNARTSPFNSAWLSAVSVNTDTEEQTDSENETEQPSATPAVSPEKQQLAIKQWQSANPDWKGAFAVWETLRDQENIQRSQIATALQHLTEGQRFVQRPENASQINDLSRIQWNEIVYLEKLSGELVWPDNENEMPAFSDLVHLSMVARDESNKLASAIAPTLTSKFQKQFEKLDNGRRLLEDRLFSNDRKNLNTDFKDAANAFRQLSTKHNALLANFRSMQSQLIQTPHDFRYSLESLAVQSQSGNDIGAREKRINEFRKWIEPENGFSQLWKELSQHSIGTKTERDKDDAADEIQRLSGRLTTFSETKTGGFLRPANTDSVDIDVKDLASNPYLDADTLMDNDPSMSAADGNLLARRLLLWPGINLDIRKKIHNGLLTKSVDETGEIEDKNLEFSNAAISEKVTNLMQSDAMRMMSASDVEKIELDPEDENCVTRIAAESHRFVFDENDENSNNLGKAINYFRSRKSDFDFNRVAADLWGNQTSSNESFVQSSLKNHDAIVNYRVQNVPFRRDDTRDRIEAVWQSGPAKQWPLRIASVNEFCDGFSGEKWDWNPRSQKATNTNLTPLIKLERNAGNEMRFALAPKQRVLSKVRNGKFDLSNEWLDHETIPGTSLNVYLRGHQTVFGISSAPVEQKSKFLEVTQDSDNARGAELLVKKETKGSVAGHITIVIDCSLSMRTGGRMEDAKRNIIDFIKLLQERQDISISLVAIGAAEIWKSNDAGWEVRKRSELASWNPSPEADVWFFQKNGIVVNEQTAELFVTAINELKAWGETPILDGLTQTLKTLPGQTDIPKLVVLLTDGFEFGNKNKKNGERFASFDPKNLYSDLSLEFQSETELVVFSFLKKGIDEAFRDMIQKGVDSGEIRNRIERIKLLATINRRASETSLKKFFTALLPQPRVFVKDRDGGNTLANPRVTNGIDLDDNGQLTDEERRIMASIELGADQRPQNWSIGVEFSQESDGNAARSFSKSVSEWRSSTKLFGNERLEYGYNQFLKSFKLTTDMASRSKTKQMNLGETPLWIAQTINTTNKPGFQFASTDETKLTPAPAIAYLTLGYSNQTNPHALIQDFNLKRQTRSNVHPLRFPEFPDSLRNAIFDERKPVNLTLNMISRFAPQFWSKIYVTETERWKLENDAEKDLEIKPGIYESINKLLPKTELFAKYSIELRRENSETDYANYSIRIRSLNPEDPIDSWLVQVLGADGQINRNVVRNSRRSYEFKDKRNRKMLIGVEHHFSVIKRELQKERISFGLKHLDELAEKDVDTMGYPKYFNEQ